jgi:hypothetical protein
MNYLYSIRTFVIATPKKIVDIQAVTTPPIFRLGHTLNWGDVKPAEYFESMASEGVKVDKRNFACRAGSRRLRKERKSSCVWFLHPHLTSIPNVGEDLEQNRSIDWTRGKKEYQFKTPSHWEVSRSALTNNNR